MRPARDVIADMIGAQIVLLGIGPLPDHTAQSLVIADQIIAQLIANSIAITGSQLITDPNEPPQVLNA
jgi:hypothetical protein